MRLAVVLLYTTGLRLGELQRLTLGDIEDDGGLLRVRESKFHRSRVLPLSASTRVELLALFGPASQRQLRRSRRRRCCVHAAADG